MLLEAPDIMLVEEERLGSKVVDDLKKVEISANEILGKILITLKLEKKGKKYISLYT